MNNNKLIIITGAFGAALTAHADIVNNSDEELIIFKENGGYTTLGPHSRYNSDDHDGFTTRRHYENEEGSWFKTPGEEVFGTYWAFDAEYNGYGSEVESTMGIGDWTKDDHSAKEEAADDNSWFEYWRC
jgi:hypothetical protein